MLCRAVLCPLVRRGLAHRRPGWPCPSRALRPGSRRREHPQCLCVPGAFVLPPRGAVAGSRGGGVACGGSRLCPHVLSGPVGLRGLILTFLVGVGAASLGACLLPCPAHFQLCFESALSVGEGSPGSVPDACLFILSRGLLRCRSPCCGSCPAPHHCPGTGPWRLALLCARTERWFLLLLDRMPSLLHALFCTPGASLLKGSRAGRQGVRVDMGT